ncbi:MAG: hypothetical protein ACQETH_13065 [Candidatus Rifleibacteriota bacterium]
MSNFLKSAAFFSIIIIVSTVLNGCAAEKPSALAKEDLNGNPPKQELVSMELDARGIINGVFQPGDTTPYSDNFYPVNYSGDWSLIHAGEKSDWYMMTTDAVGARVDLVATLSRAVFEFWDYEFYDNPGEVTFYIDGKNLGTYDLARANEAGDKFLTYQVATQKNSIATISMVLKSGRVTIAGYLLNFLDERFPY